MLLYKDDWDDAKKRFEAFWECDMIDRCCIAISAPRTKPLETSLPEIADDEILPVELKDPLFKQWTDSPQKYAILEWASSLVSFMGEAFPNHFTNLGPGMLAACLGTDYTFTEQTVWFGQEPIIKDWNARPEIVFNKNHEIWKTAINMTNYFSKRAPGRFVTGMTDLGGSFDIAVSMRGNEQLIYDMMDRPDDISWLIEKIDQAWIEALGILYSIIQQYSDGMTGWMPVWNKGKWFPIQCDFGTLLSPSMFEQFVRPSLERQTRALDKGLFHLDGPAMVKHIDCILDIDTIHAIQWRPTEYNGPDASYLYDSWIALYKKIQDKKRGIVLLNVPPQDIEGILKYVSPKGLFMTTQTATEEEGMELLKKVKDWSRIKTVF